MESEKVKKSISKRILKFGMWFFGIILSIMLLISAGLYFFKDDICGYVIKQVNQNLKAKVSVSEVDLAFWGSFPNLSVDFNEVFIQDSYQNSTLKDTLLFSDQIRLKFNPLDIWNEKYNVKQIEIAPGTLKLKINKAGNINYDIFKKSSDTTASKFKLNLKEVNIEQIRFSYKNSLTHQYYASTIHQLDLNGAFTEKQFTLQSQINMHINQIKSGDVALISNKDSHFNIAISVNQETGNVLIPPCTIYIANLPFDLNGKVTPKNLNFNIQAKELELVDVATNFTHSSLENIDKFGGSGTVHFKLAIAGKLEKNAPTNIDCDFGIQNGSLIEPAKGLKLNNIKLTGKYSNLNGTENEYVKLSNISFSSPGGPFAANILITHFEAPIIQGNAHGNIDLTVANGILKLTEIQEVNGNIKLNSSFLVETIYDEIGRSKLNLEKCEGNIEMQNITLQLINDKRKFRNVKGSIYLRDNEAGIDNVSLNVGTSDLKVDGVFQNIIGFVRGENNLNANVAIQSNYVNVQDLSTETKQEQISDGRNWILPIELEGNMDVNVQELKYEKHLFKSLRGNFTMKNRMIHFPELTVSNANANIRGGLIIEERTPEIFTIATKATSDNVEMKPLFKEWENFHQEIITENNIFGKIRVFLEFEAPFDLRSGIVEKEIKSKIQLRISDGRLKNVLAFKSITESMKNSSAKFILNKENINEFEKKLLDLKFENFENTFLIRNGKLEIPSMTILSNALDIKLEGIHDFNNTIDYRFAFRFRELKQQKSEEEFGEIIDDGTGVKLFVRMTGNMDNPKIVWDNAAKKQQAKENREAAKQDAKSILKSEFGLFKNDSTVKNFNPIVKPKEELKIEFGPDKPLDSKQKDSKKDSKINKTLNKWKQEAGKEKKEEFEDIN
ncbi:MAG: hypothetical protein HYR91_12420 [Flavobacteriia bacterium]|nr:hypothetical protein [Flavobacteriia bacterium]